MLMYSKNLQIELNVFLHFSFFAAVLSLSYTRHSKELLFLSWINRMLEKKKYREAM